MNESISKLISELLEIHNSGRATVFFDFAGHVNKIEVRIYVPKWEPETDPHFVVSAYIESSEDFRRFEEEINRFIKLFKLLNDT